MTESTDKEVQNATTLVLKVTGRVFIFAICLGQALMNASEGHPFYGILWIWLAGLLVLPNADSKFEVNINTGATAKQPEATASLESESDIDSEHDTDDVEPEPVPESDQKVL